MLKKHIKNVGIILGVVLMSLILCLTFTACEFSLFGTNDSTQTNENNSSGGGQVQSNEAVVKTTIETIQNDCENANVAQGTTTELTGNSEYGIDYRLYSQFVMTDYTLSYPKQVLAESLSLYNIFRTQVAGFGLRKMLKSSFTKELDTTGYSVSPERTCNGYYYATLEDGNKIVVYHKIKVVNDYKTYAGTNDDYVNSTQIVYIKTIVNLNSDKSINNIEFIMYEEEQKSNPSTNLMAQVYAVVNYKGGKIANYACFIKSNANADSGFQHIDFEKNIQLMAAASDTSAFFDGLDTSIMTKAQYLEAINNYVDSKVVGSSLILKMNSVFVIDSATIDVAGSIYSQIIADAGFVM